MKTKLELLLEAVDILDDYYTSSMSNDELIEIAESQDNIELADFIRNGYETNVLVEGTIDRTWFHKNVLNYDIWVDPSGADRRSKHSLPRVKIKINEDEKLPVLIPRTNNEKARVPESSMKNASLSSNRPRKYKKGFEFIDKYSEIFLTLYEYSDTSEMYEIKYIKEIFKNIDAGHSINDSIDMMLEKHFPRKTHIDYLKY